MDGELVIWRGGAPDWSAVQSRAASTLARAHALAVELPASYPVWDCIGHPVYGDLHGRPDVARMG